MKVVFGKEVEIDYSSTYMNKLERVAEESGYTLAEYVRLAIENQLKRDSWVLDLKRAYGSMSGEMCYESALRSLEKKGYEILDKHYGAADIVIKSKDDGSLVFCKFEVTFDEDQETLWTRYEADRVSSEYARDKKIPADTRFRFDSVCALINSTHSAILRHHLDAMGE